MKNKRIILDTNLWISFLISNKLDQLDQLIFNKTITLIFSEELIEEFLEVAFRPKFKRFFNRDNIELLLKHFDEYGIMVEVKSNLDICRDPKDNFILNLAADSNADYLITGDQDLLILEKIQGAQIITINQFFDKFL